MAPPRGWGCPLSDARPKPKESTSVTLRINPELLGVLDSVATATGATRTTVIKQALVREFTQRGVWPPRLDGKDGEP